MSSGGGSSTTNGTTTTKRESIITKGRGSSSTEDVSVLKLRIQEVGTKILTTTPIWEFKNKN